ncbi:hypothetical protein KP509_19G074700 [Ceratopteris richardii]|uniref:EGF-like domain-containing protein n=1 Tax=Ceratopteris richardii TaxID=49495 RepID=A0A8T2SLG7_CERRI|nr:hypothetical protein KP509_19G074700 [Ceratopteris richardii]KAH7353005.1 hypothetical protein KP509_19G074700 [Ceratopteris richardii]KAH7353006.1 hypothetical protein KP509_19G074700 [Ceratopteris richardii]
MHAPTWLWIRSSSVVLRLGLLLASLFLAYYLLAPLPALPALLWFKSDHSLVSSKFASPISLGSVNRSPPPRTSYPPPSSQGVSIQYRNAPWKWNVGYWLSHCYDHSRTISVEETISDKPCPEDCSGHGNCNHGDGRCRCFHGYHGPSCKNVLNLQCNLKASEDSPYGKWVVSICPAYCDKTKAMCFCGNGTKYPDRPVAESCGFELKGNLVDWAKADFQNIFANEDTKKGWCNIDVTDLIDGHMQVKEQCDCKYDCTAGRFCEIAIQCFCINQCSGNGICNGGSCQCRKGWYGIDCSVPSPLIAKTDWPEWLRREEALPVSEFVPSDANRTYTRSKSVQFQKRHPLIYIYDLPPEFNSHLLEGRHWRYECVNRLYDQENTTFWTSQLYGAEIALYESLLNSPHRTLNGEEADFFYVPVLGACLIARADETPHLNMKNFMGLRSYITLDLFRQAYFHISQSYPFWNRTAGRDHIWFFSWDEGACYAPKEIWNSMMLVHWGNTNAKYNYSTTCYLADSWNAIPITDRGDHVCFNPQKDLVMPAWKLPDPDLVTKRYWERTKAQRKILFYFNGNLGNAYEYGRPEENYSMGLRQKLAKVFGSSPTKDGLLGRQVTQDVIVTNRRSNHYSEELASSKFCGVLPGDGWSGRMEDSILHGCIPVIIQDGIQLPYENVLEYRDFTVRIEEEKIPQLVQILRAINETELDMMFTVIKSIWQRFFYRDSVLKEAQRQKKYFNKSSHWASAFSTLEKEEDALSTFLQVLHYKLYNDRWRLGSPKQQLKKAFLPEDCPV